MGTVTLEELLPDAHVRIRRRGPALVVTRGPPLMIEATPWLSAAPPSVLAAVVAYATSRSLAATTDAMTLIQRYVDAEPRRLRTSWAHHELRALLQEVQVQHFPALAPVAVGWGPRRATGHRTRVALATYDFRRRDISVLAALDAPTVPAWVVRFLLYHELLHALLGPSAPGEPHHSAEFRRQEMAHPDWARTVEWERRELPALLGWSDAPC